MPMNEIEYLLQCLSEECSEVSQRISKALRFSLEEAQPGQAQTNIERIYDELVDLQGVAVMLFERGIIADSRKENEGINNKIEKVLRFMEYSRERGCLLPTPPKTDGGE